MAYPQHSKLSRENSVGAPMGTTGRVRVLLIGGLKDFRNRIANVLRGPPYVLIVQNMACGVIYSDHIIRLS